MSYLLGVDVGSTNLKAVLFDLEGKQVAKADVPTESAHPDKEHPDWSVWKPEQIWSGIAESIQKAVSSVDASKILGVSVTGMGMDGLPLDKDGKWLYPFINWHCPRTQPQQAWWQEHVGAERQFELCGDPIWPFNTALRLLWMREHEPEILDRTHKWVLIEDFINFMLCGEYATDYSMASNTLLFDQRTRTWNDELLELSGIDSSLLCDPKPSGTVLGTVHKAAAERTGLKQGTPVVLGGHDYSCGCLPTGAFEPGVVLDVMGTWEMVVAALNEPVLTPDVLNMGVLMDSHVARDKYAAMAATVAGDMLEWFKREHGTEERIKAEAGDGIDWDLLTALSASAPLGSNGIFFLPHMSGAHCPTPDAASAGAFVGLRNNTSRADMLRAMIEGLNYEFLQIVRSFEAYLNIKSDKIVAIGGPTRNHFWMQNKADVAGITVEVPDIDEAVPLGAAILAGIGTEVYADEQDAFQKVYRPGKAYQPDTEAHEKYTALYARYQTLYPALKQFYQD